LPRFCTGALRSVAAAAVAIAASLRFTIVILNQLQHVSRNAFAERSRARYLIAVLRIHQCFAEDVLNTPPVPYAPFTHTRLTV